VLGLELACAEYLAEVPWILVERGGDICHELEEVGREYEADAIVVGSTHGIVGRIFGSVAGRLAKPVLIHCREAHDETLAILADARLGETGGIMHCFSGDVAIARRCLDLGLTISLAGPVTYPNARALPEVARFVPADRLVVETDCPFLPPQGHRGKRNEPAYLALTAARVAGLRGEPLTSLGPVMRDNARRLFGLS